MRTSAVMHFHSLVQTLVFPSPLRALVSSAYSNKHHHFNITSHNITSLSIASVHASSKDYSLVVSHRGLFKPSSLSKASRDLVQGVAIIISQPTAAP